MPAFRITIFKISVTLNQESSNGGLMSRIHRLIAFIAVKTVK